MHKLGTSGVLSERQARSAGALLGCFIGSSPCCNSLSPNPRQKEMRWVHHLKVGPPRLSEKIVVRSEI